MRSLLHLLLTAAATTAVASSQTTVYVDEGLTTGASDGSSWANAFQGRLGLQDALADLTGPGRIFVAAGRYAPSVTGDREASFVIDNGVEVYGGFRGGETSIDERPAFGTATTVLTGDLADNDAGAVNREENSRRVVVALSVSIPGVLDGLVIRDGELDVLPGGGNGAGLHIGGTQRFIVRECRFVSNRARSGGAAIGSHSLQGVTITDSLFEQNIGDFRGGALFISGETRVDRCRFVSNIAEDGGAIRVVGPGQVVISNSVFHDNLATFNSSFATGGAILCENAANTIITGCTVFGNRAAGFGIGGISDFGPGPSIQNCIVWGNENGSGTESLQAQCSSPNKFSASIVRGIGGLGVDNLDVDPEFMDASVGDFRLAATSPAIDAASSTAVPADVELDFSGTRRRVDAPGVPDTGSGPGPAVDMGALEFSDQVGRVFCSPLLTSEGVAPRLDAVGSSVAADNDVTLVARELPLNSSGFFLVAPLRTEGVIVPASGRLCLGGPIGRYVGPGEVMNSGPTGTFSLSIDVGQIPRPMGTAAATAGDAWAFQAWFRDSVLGIPVSNFTDGVLIRFQ